MLAAVMWGLPKPAIADTHLPIIDIVPTSSFTLTSDGFNLQGGPKPPGVPPATNGDIEINGTITFPITRALSFSFDRIGLGGLDANLSAINIPGVGRLFPGGARDLLRSYRADYRIRNFNIEGGFASRYRRCCPADSLEWHKGYLGFTYATPSTALLNGGVLIVGITGNASHHNLSPEALAKIPPGLALRNNIEVFTTQQSATAVVPIDKRSGLRFAATFLWGALDPVETAPFPWYSDIWFLALTKQVNQNFALTFRSTNVHQRNQGAPFPATDAIRNSDLSILAEFHFDFNRIVQRPIPQPQPVQPGTPGGPGGPGRPGPTQGGTATPAPEPGSSSASAAPSPAP